MTLSYLKTSFSCVPTKTISCRFQETSLWGPFSKICVFGSRKFRLRVDERPKRRKKSPFSRKYQDRCARDLNSLRSKRFRAVSRVKDRAKNGPSPSLLFHFWALVSFLARPKPRIPFLGLSLLRNSTETLATQARTLKVAVSTVPSDKGIGQI